MTTKAEKPFLKRFNMSYSTYSNYKQSQLQFFFEKVSQTQDKTDRVPQVYGICGNIVHDICEAKILDKDLNTDDMFIKLWYEKQIDNMKGIYGKKMSQERYQTMLDACINVVNFLHSTCDEVIPELKIQFDEPLLSNMTIKGFIDVVVKIGDDVILYDWKTNTKPTQELHEAQRLFYAWLYWKEYGVVVKECRWYYAEINDFKNDFYTLEQIKEFELLLYKTIREIEDKGEDISKYEIGNYDTPFNAYRTACLREKNNRKNALCYGIASWGNVATLVGDITPLLQKGLDKRLQYEKKDAHWIRKNSNWDGIVRFYNKRKNAFPTGLRSEVVKVLNDYAAYFKKDIEIEYKDMTKATGYIDVPNKLLNIDLRSYQNEASHAFFMAKYGIIKMVTGMGKTLTAAEIIRKVATNTLWIINRKILLEQTKEVLEEVLGVPIGTITDGEFNPEEITICTYQTLAKHAKNNLGYLQTIGFIVIDEVHGASSKSIKAICDLCPNTKYRLGLSATPDLKDDFMEVQGLVGPVIFELDKSDERNKTFLSESKLTFVEINDADFAQTGDYHEVYNAYIVNNDLRNEKIKEIVEKHKGKNILIITKLIDHADKLSEMLDCPSLLGKTKKDDRDAITNGYRSPGGFVAIGSIQIVSEGWDIKELDVVIQAAAPASPIKTIQGLGRVLRKHEDKEQAYYYDFIDKHERLFRGASRNRKFSLMNEGHNVKVETIDTIDEN